VECTTVKYLVYSALLHTPYKILTNDLGLL
jgi:hypothetical protein